MDWIHKPSPVEEWAVRELMAHMKIVQSWSLKMDETEDIGVPMKIAGTYIEKTMPLRKKIELRMKQLNEEQAKLQSVIDLLNTNPGYEQIHDALAKIGHWL